MKSSAQVVVVGGGGVVGASVLYHLTKAGWTDVVLLERKQLTAGSTWHAAGGMHTLNGDPNVARLQQYTVNLYKEIEAESGQNCGIHLPGGLQLADTPERLDWLRMAQARGRYLGMHMEIISMKEAKELNPLLEEKFFVGALYDEDEGSVDPYGVTHAYAICARNRGAEVYTDTWVTDLQQRQPTARGSVITDRDHTIHAEHVVNAGGLWAREVGRMCGLELPVLGDGAPLPDDRADARGHRSTTQTKWSRAAAHDRLRRRDLRPPGGPEHPARHLRAGQPGVGPEGDPVGLRVPAAPPRPRPHLPRTREGRSSTSPPVGKAPASRSSSTVPSRSAPTATRWSARSRA
jgi:glycine/D-amino acid oxidase-like deaminating enzyme